MLLPLKAVFRECEGGHGIHDEGDDRRHDGNEETVVDIAADRAAGIGDKSRIVLCRKPDLAHSHRVGHGNGHAAGLRIDGIDHLRVATDAADLRQAMLGAVLQRYIVERQRLTETFDDGGLAGIRQDARREFLQVRLRLEGGEYQPGDRREHDQQSDNQEAVGQHVAEVHSPAPTPCCQQAAHGCFGFVERNISHSANSSTSEAGEP